MTVFKGEKLLVSIPPKEKDAIKVALTFPNEYKVGMASLGYQTAWKLFNENENVKTVRWFTDIKEDNITPEYLGFSFSWELDYTNIFEVIEKNNIPLHSKNRNETHPLVFAGGGVVGSNPEPFTENFDFLLIGDLEEITEALTNKMQNIKSLKRKDKLKSLSELPGIYVPGFTFTPTKKLATKKDLTFSSFLTPNSVWEDTFIVEVVRSCPELCRFCLASYGSLPFRTPDIKNSLIPIIELGLKHTNRLGLLGASITQHPDFEELLQYLREKNKTAPLQVQIASVRADTITKTLAEGLVELGIKSVTIAIESGSEKLRKIINKKVSNETIIGSVKTLHKAGINKVKLYGMVGLPGEEEKDLIATIDLLKQIKSECKGLKIVWGCSTFVPKAGTPFQYFGVNRDADKKLKFYTKEFHKIGIETRAESYKWSCIQAFISRGDKSINKALEYAYRDGASLGSFKKAFKEYKNEIPVDKFIFDNWSLNDKLPWDNILGHLSKSIINDHTKELSHIG